MDLGGRHPRPAVHDIRRPWTCSTSGQRPFFLHVSADFEDSLLSISRSFSTPSALPISPSSVHVERPSQGALVFPADFQTIWRLNEPWQAADWVADVGRIIGKDKALVWAFYTRQCGREEEALARRYHQRLDQALLVCRQDFTDFRGFRGFSPTSNVQNL